MVERTCLTVTIYVYWLFCFKLVLKIIYRALNLTVDERNRGRYTCTVRYGEHGCVLVLIERVICLRDWPLRKSLEMAGYGTSGTLFWFLERSAVKLTDQYHWPKNHPVARKVINPAILRMSTWFMPVTCNPRAACRILAASEHLTRGRVSRILLITYSVEQSPWEANRFSASQEIPRILWNSKAY
jgi:hypothetical protein